MEKYNSDLTQSLKWMQNEAPDIQAIIQGYQDWRVLNNENFWNNWYNSVFNIDTANNFGLVVWCIILGVSNDIVSFQQNRRAFAFGKNRQNFQADEDSGLDNPNLIGGNFFGSNGKVSGIEEIRFILKLKYASLVSNGKFIFINRMLNYIVNKGDKMGIPDDNIIVLNNTSVITPAITDQYYWEYRIGKNVTINGKQISSGLFEVLNDRDNGLVPSSAGVKYLFIQES